MIPGLYTAPSQFYAHLGPAGREGSVSDPPETPTPSVHKRADSTAPSPPPPKHPRGRPPGSTNKGSGNNTALKATKSKSKAAPKSKTQPVATPTVPEASKENIPPVVTPNLLPPIYELSDDDDDDVKADGASVGPIQSADASSIFSLRTCPRATSTRPTLDMSTAGCVSLTVLYLTNTF
jgi:hypothetical protein